MSKKIALWAIFAALLAGFVLDWQFVSSGAAKAFDTAVQNFFFDMRTDSLTSFFKFITVFGDTKTVGAVCAALIFFPVALIVVLSFHSSEPKNKKLARRARDFLREWTLPLASFSIAGGLIHTVLKHIVERARPLERYWLVPEDGYSFPSGHSNVSLILYFALAFILAKKLSEAGKEGLSRIVRFALPLLVLFIGISRIYLGVHYPTDVLGGFLLGGSLFTLGYITLLRK